MRFNATAFVKTSNITVCDAICNIVQLHLIQYAIQYNMRFNATAFDEVSNITLCDAICNIVQLHLMQYAIQYNCICNTMNQCLIQCVILLYFILPSFKSAQMTKQQNIDGAGQL